MANYVTPQREDYMEPKAAAPRLVCVASYLNTCEADFARMALKAEGIPASLENANIVQWFWNYSSALGGVKLYVQEGHVQKAERVLTTSCAPKWPRPEELSETLLKLWQAAVLSFFFFPLLAIYVFWRLLHIDGEKVRTTCQRRRYRAAYAATLLVMPYGLFWLFALIGGFILLCVNFWEYMHIWDYLGSLFNAISELYGRAPPGQN